MSRPAVISCAVFGGRNPKDGKLVGERHRWSGGSWGEGHCIYCHRDLEQVLARPKKELTLGQALANDQAAFSKTEWHPSHWHGDMGIAKGWYITRKPTSGGHEWLKDTAGKLVRFDSHEDALAYLNTGAAGAAST